MALSNRISIGALVDGQKRGSLKVPAISVLKNSKYELIGSAEQSPDIHTIN
jgi:hypothetical protein